jgi:arsenite methyltransferase
MTAHRGPVTPDERIKACCAQLYGSEWARLLLGGDSFHPGGLALTERLAELLRLDSDANVLDLACGRGASALHLARRFGWRVVGTDLSAANLGAARQAVASARLTHLVELKLGDAERLQLEDRAFDAVICECAFCLFPDKDAAAAECARMLRRGGRLGIADLTRRGPLPPELETLAAWVSCIAGARPIDDYIANFEMAGFRVQTVEPHDDALAALVRSVRLRLLGAEVLAKLGKAQISARDIERAKAVAKAAAMAVGDGRLGYSLLVAERR